MKAGDICTYCDEGILELITEDEPWTCDYLICPSCDSTFLPEEYCEEE